ncbi:BTB/POZ domain-containing protein 6-B-like [Paramacrobiotus metropolitanus]|uniref:BTB/POZ domain-containing protein 6-B-like n=1 Tax=Paramacrobiotus metropolitanus TaxID=2943436 RepID=UPI0024457F4E|nr:BTB/POZ domain-containing protein 6-B-like [Paramacrobiotus metropolitanus]
MRSPVFRTMFYGSLPENCDHPIPVPDVHPDAFANMLSYFYTNDVELSRNTVFPTRFCADRYDVPLLVDHCSRFILSQLEAGNCLMYLDKAVKWNAEDIVESCLKLVDMHTEGILRSKRFSKLDRKSLELILQRSTLQAAENAIYMAVEKWAAAACARINEEPTAANRRRVLGDLLYLVRFPLMSDQELLDGPAESNLLLQSEWWDIFRLKHAKAKPETPFFAQPRLSPGFVPLPPLPDGIAPTTESFSRSSWWIRKFIQSFLWLAGKLLGYPVQVVPANCFPIFGTIVLRRGEGIPLGISIVRFQAGGRDCGVPIYVKRILIGGSAHKDGRLLPGDQIIRLNGVSLQGATHDEAVSVFGNAGNNMAIDVMRLSFLAVRSPTAHHNE